MFRLQAALPEDKPLKYPTIFNTADVTITKIDLAAAVKFDAAAARRSIEAVRQGMEIFEVSAKTGAGINVWLEFLKRGARGEGQGAGAGVQA